MYFEQPCSLYRVQNRRYSPYLPLSLHRRQQALFHVLVAYSMYNPVSHIHSHTHTQPHTTTLVFVHAVHLHVHVGTMYRIIYTCCCRLQTVQNSCHSRTTPWLVFKYPSKDLMSVKIIVAACRQRGKSLLATYNYHPNSPLPSSLKVCDGNSW